MLVGRKPLTVVVAPDITKRPDLPVIPPAPNGGKMIVREMQQLYPDSADRPALVFKFPMSISSIQHEAATVAYEEVGRPLSLPLLDTSMAQLHKVSIEFMISAPLDGVAQPIEEQIATLRDMSASDTPVIFSNVHDALKGAWKISAFSFSVTRTDELGRLVMANASMSLTESTDRLERFIQLPKFTYKVPKGSGTPGTPGTTDPTVTAETVWSTWLAKLGDQYTTTQATRDTLDRYITEKGAATVNNILKSFTTTANTPETLLNAVIQASLPSNTR